MNTTGKPAPGEDDIIFVALESDPKGVATLATLDEISRNSKRFYHTLTLPAHRPDLLPRKYVAVFGLGTDPETISKVGKGGYYLRAAAHRLDDQTVVPEWALKTPYRIGVFRTTDRGLYKKGLTPSTFRSAVDEVAGAYIKWSPGVSGWPAPWTKTDALPPAPEHVAQFDSWQTTAVKLFGPVDALGILKAVLPKPIYIHRNLSSKPRLLFLGCATSNKPHTDIAVEIPETKVSAVTTFCRKLIHVMGDHVSEVVFSTVRSDFLLHPMLRSSLHPFYFLDVSEIEERLGTPFQDEQLRMWNRNHARSDAELAESLDYAAQLINEQIVTPVSKDSPIPVWNAKWSDLIPNRILDNAWKRAHDVTRLDKLYKDKVEAQPSWAVLDRFDREYAIQRLTANVGIYLALAQMLMENRDTIIVDFEVYTPYWQYLEKEVRDIWNGEEFSVIPVPGNVKQPWTY